jgi:glutamate carboxypeptidase
MDDTPAKTGSMVQAVWKGTGTKKILLIAHMDTVYLRGMLKDQPFRIQGDRAYGLGIADDKQGVALIVHTVAMLNRLGFRTTARSPCSSTATRRSARPARAARSRGSPRDQDVVLSFEGGGSDGSVRLATSGIGSAYLTVEGRASHAGARPEGGINALYELAHQLLQMKDLSQNDKGLKLNWTVGAGGHQPQRHPGAGDGAGRRAGAARRRLRPAPGRAAGEG